MWFLLCHPVYKLWMVFIPYSVSYKMFEVVSTYDTNVEYHISIFNYDLFLNYTDNRHTNTPTAKKCVFWNQEAL